MNQTPGIYGFFNEYRFLSNFHVCPVQHQNLEYTSSEAAYQAAKVSDIREKIPFLTATPRLARELGQAVRLPEHWNIQKFEIMREILRDKFQRNPDLAERLLETGDLYLEETNTWGDIYWGVCQGIGQNNLGKLLMQIRAELRSKENEDQLKNSTTAEKGDVGAGGSHS